MPTWQYFLRVLGPRVTPFNQEFGQDENGNPNYDQEEELWRLEFLLKAKNMGSLGNSLLLGWPLCEGALRDFPCYKRHGLYVIHGDMTNISPWKLFLKDRFSLEKFPKNSTHGESAGTLVSLGDGWGNVNINLPLFLTLLIKNSVPSG
jgi:hypothetical protein